MACLKAAIRERQVRVKSRPPSRDAALIVLTAVQRL